MYKNYYSVEHTIFGKYVEVSTEENLTDAKLVAEKFNNDGWLNVRIITPDDEVIQMFGK